MWSRNLANPFAMVICTAREAFHNVHNEPVLAGKHRCGISGNQRFYNVRARKHLSPAAMRTTEFAPAVEAAPAPVTEPASPVAYDPPKFAQRSFTGGFPGSAFPLQPDGSLRCPANHPLYPQERRPERDGSYRLLYAARIGDCRRCEWRAQCQAGPTLLQPRVAAGVNLYQHPFLRGSARVCVDAGAVGVAVTQPVLLAPRSVAPTTAR